MSSPYLAEIKMFGGNFAPRGFAFCNGQLLSIAQNSALFSLLGTTFGGNGQSTFGIPDLRGRCPVHFGQGPGLPAVQLGEQSGTPTVTLLTSQMPAHIHSLTGASASMPCSSGAGTLDNPTGAIPSGSASHEDYAAAGAATGAMASAPVSGSTGVAGSNQPFSVMQPYLGINFIIALEGIYPSRN
jgi:microcystin-dependent protein